MFDRPRALNQLAAVSLVINDRVNQALIQHSDRPLSDVTTLISVRHCETFSVGWLSGVLALTHSAAVRIVDRLEGDGLLARQPMTDRRFVGLVLTPKGVHLADELLAVRKGALEGLLTGTSDAALQSALPVLDGLLRHTSTDELTSYRICRLCDEGMCGNPCPVDEALVGH